MVEALLCLDSGTTRIKAAVYSFTGELLGFAETDNTALRRDGVRITQDMDETWALNFSVIKRCVSDAGVKIAAMIVSGQGDGLWALDNERRPFMEGIVWLDGRARELLQRLESEGTVEAIRSITQSKPTTASQTVLLRWLKENARADYERVSHALRLKDWIFHCLTGELMTETSNILAVWGDLRAGELSPRIPALMELDKGIELIPEIRHVRDCHAPLASSVAAELGIDYRFPVYIGPSDVQATAIGLGLGLRPDINSCSVFGTGSIHVGYARDLEDWVSLPSGSIIQPHALGDGFVCLHPGFNGTSIFRHIDRFTNRNDTGTITPVCTDILVLPFFEEGGERAPYTSVAAKGAVFGMRASTTPEEIRWAAREALGFLGRTSHDMFDAGDTIAVGGGLSQDRHFMEFYADCLGRQLRCSNSPNIGLYGLALLLLSCRDETAFRRVANKPDTGETIYRPRKDKHVKLERKYRKFRSLVELAIQFWERDLEGEASVT